jgi:trimeric autotransporter adhesin
MGTETNSAIYGFSRSTTGRTGRFEHVIDGPTGTVISFFANTTVTNPGPASSINAMYVNANAPTANAPVRGMIAEGLGGGVAAIGVQATGYYAGANTTVSSSMPSIIGVLARGGRGAGTPTTLGYSSIGLYGHSSDNQVGTNVGVVGIGRGSARTNIGLIGMANGSDAQLNALTSGLATGYSAGVYAYEVTGTGNALVANYAGGAASTTTGGNIAIFQSAGANVARIDNTGKGYFNGGTQSSGADVAEAFSVEGDRAGYEPGEAIVRWS